MTTHRGGTTVITRTLKGAAGQVTVVGEVPINTARKVVESVEPVIY
jgi:negative regulator of sigma E activity